MITSPPFKTVLLCFLTFCAFSLTGRSETPPKVTLHWLDTAVAGVGTTWGVPWPEGKLQKDATFSLHNESGEAVPVQTWPLATWPDGSLKWSAHAMVAGKVPATSFTLAPGDATAPATSLKVGEDKDAITIDTGVLQCRVLRNGDQLVDSISRAGKVIASAGRLVCLRRDTSEPGPDGIWREEAFQGKISAVTVEQSGPLRAVIKIEGQHANANRKWLPFIVRLYFYAGSDAVRVMHTIIFDGDAKKDFISGLGLRFSVPMHGELYDRHVRFAGEDHGLWAEAVRGLTGLRRDPGAAVRAAQIAGIAVPPLDQWKAVKDNLEYVAAFGDFALFQPTADSFEIRKRTKPGVAWLNSAYGHRAAGLGYVGTPAGGLAFGIRNFWQSHPTQLDIRDATKDSAEVTMWLWSPETRPMDMRFYHDGMGEDTYAKQLKGLDTTYEDYEPGFDTPLGVARTSEMMLWALPATPSREQTVALADALRTPPQLVCAPSDLKAAAVFGGSIWNLPDRSTPTKAAIEDQLDFFFAFYQKEVEQRHWYGFWNYGDVMHTYDTDRHVWRYDVGGFAWDNSELSTDLWLWYAFLRSGRADIFRMAEAMTRHTGEVDVYHLGRFAGLGTRHGVMHWGDSAKQLRISTAANRRFYYYLTADERVGDLLSDEVNADRKLAEFSPRRKLTNVPKDELPVNVSVGTDWGAISAAVLTAWERTGDTKYRDKLLTSMKSIAALPHGWLSGGGDYDPATGRFSNTTPRIDTIHLNAVFGAVEINAELLQLLDVPAYRDAWLQYCELFNAPKDEQKEKVGQALPGWNLGQGHSRLTAYVAAQQKDPQLAARAWKEFFGAAAGLKLLPKPYPVTELSGPDVLNPIEEAHLSTNAVAQWGLAAMQCLGLVGDQVPEQPVK